MPNPLLITLPPDYTLLARKVWGQGVMRRQVEMLGELAEIGLQVAREAGRRVTANDDASSQTAHPLTAPAQDSGLQAAGDAPDDDRSLDDPSTDDASPTAGPAGAAARLGDLAMAYARAARGVRLSLMLQAKAMEELRRLERPEPPSFDDDDDYDDPPTPEQEHKTRVARIVRRVARAAHAGDEAEIDRLTLEASERLDDEDLYRDLMDRPLGELVACICRDLGLDPDWARLAGEAWAGDELDDPRSPFAAMAPSPAHPEARRATSPVETRRPRCAPS